jgi:hypothetical protein
MDNEWYGSWWPKGKEKQMNRAYLVWNVSKTAVDPEKGLLIGPGHLTEGGSYSSILLYSTLDAAIKKAEEFARGGSAGVIFEVLEAHIIKPVPIEVITFSLS